MDRPANRCATESNSTVQTGCQSITAGGGSRLQHAEWHGNSDRLAAAAAGAARACALPLTPRNTSCSLPFFLSACCAMATVFRPATRVLASRKSDVEAAGGRQQARGGPGGGGSGGGRVVGWARCQSCPLLPVFAVVAAVLLRMEAGPAGREAPKAHP